LIIKNTDCTDFFCFERKKANALKNAKPGTSEVGTVLKKTCREKLLSIYFVYKVKEFAALKNCGFFRGKF